MTMLARLFVLVLAATIASTAPASAQGGDAGPRLPVRFGVHKDFERMVFDWTTAVEYRVETAGR